MIAALFLSACSSGSQKTDPPKPQENNQTQAPAVKKPAKGGEYVYHVPSDPDTFAFYWASSAYTTTVTDKVFGGGLLMLNAQTLQPEPWLAEAMPTVGADNKTYTFKLRKGVKYHDGVEVKAQDIAFAYEILMSDDYKGRSKSAVAQLESVKALDDYTVEFKTKTVFAPFMFSVPYYAPLPKHILGNVPVKDMAAHEFWKKPIGAGPWKFVEWKPGEHTLLERNDDYWAKDRELYALASDKAKKGVVGPYFDRIRIRVIPETNTAIAALEAGELSYYGSMEPGNVDRLKAEKKDVLVGYDWDRMGYGYQTFNLEKFPTDILEVRQALSHGLNRQAIIQGVMDNKASLPAGFVPPIHWIFNKDLKPYNYDPKKAEELIQKAGFTKGANGFYQKDGKPLKVVYYATKGNPIVEGIALASQKDWQAIGIEVQLEMVDFNTVLKNMREGGFNIVFSGIGFSVDPYISFNAFNTKSILKDDKGVNQGSNTSRFSNPEVDALLEKGMTTIDLNERKKIYQQAEQLIMAAAPVNPIYVNLWTDFIKKDIKGVAVANGYGLVGLDQYYVTEQ
ncbi:MAG: ABC transporter substrate-binding protein [Bacillota bacterium]